MSDSVRPHRRQPIRLHHPWDSPGKNTGVGCHFLLQCMKVKVKSLSHVRLLATPWTAAYQAPLSMGFSRQKYWSGVPLPSPIICLKVSNSLNSHAAAQLSRRVLSYSWEFILKHLEDVTPHRGSQIVSNSCVSPQERKTITCFSIMGYLVIILVVILVTSWRFLILLYLPLYCAAHQVKH